jgi:hypothetical protein
MDPETIAEDFSLAIVLADGRAPVAVNARSGMVFQAGLGPHSESAAIQLLLAELRQMSPDRYGSFALGIPYPRAPRQRCDVCLGIDPNWTWAIEVKLVRLLGDNGKPNDNMIMHLLSPYSAHRSALSDCEKLAGSGLGDRQAILIYGFESDAWPLAPLMDAFEALAQRVVRLGPRAERPFDNLVHPIHRRGGVFVWELMP